MWKVIAQRCSPIVVPLWLRHVASRQRVINHRRVIAVAPAYRPNQRVLVCNPRQSRHVLTDADARHVRADGRERPANFLWRLGLQVPHVLMRRPAKKVNENARLGPVTPRSCLRQPRCKHPRRRQPRTGAQKLPTIPGHPAGHQLPKFAASGFHQAKFSRALRHPSTPIEIWSTSGTGRL